MAHCPTNIVLCSKKKMKQKCLAHIHSKKKVQDSQYACSANYNPWLGRVIYYQVGEGRVHSGGGGVGIFLVMCGLKMKWPKGRGVMYLVRYLRGGGRCVLLVFVFIKSHSFWVGFAPQIPQYPIFITLYFLNHWGGRKFEHKMYPVLVKQPEIFLFLLFTFSFRAFNNNQ